jgi:hypothetical protein
MGRIDVGDAIDRYQALLRMRHLTKQQKRDIQLKIHQLQQDAEGEASGFDLDVGSIKMPTLYDVRRGFDPIRNQLKQARRDASQRVEDVRGQINDSISSNVSHMYDSRAQVQATINIQVNDKNAAGEVYGAIDRAMGTHLRARMRSKGHRG